VYPSAHETDASSEPVPLHDDLSFLEFSVQSTAACAETSGTCVEVPPGSRNGDESPSSESASTFETRMK
jgi:hypothetical protein